MKAMILVTGGSGALGSAVVERLKQNGEVLSVDTEDVDLSDFEATNKWAKGKGPLSAIVALAGGFSMCDLSDMGSDDFHSSFNMNACTAFSTLAAFGHALKDGGAVVLVGSPAYEGAAGMSAYAASKAAVVSLAKSAAEEWKSRRIRVNAILPRIIDTPSNRKAMPDADFDTWQKPAEIAEVIAFLVSDGAAIVSGNEIHLDRVR